VAAARNGATVTANGVKLSYRNITESPGPPVRAWPLAGIQSAFETSTGRHRTQSGPWKW